MSLKGSSEVTDFAREILLENIVCLLDAICAQHIRRERAQGGEPRDDVCNIAETERAKNGLDVCERFSDTKGVCGGVGTTDR